MDAMALKATVEPMTGVPSAMAARHMKITELTGVPVNLFTCGFACVWLGGWASGYVS